MKLLTNKQAAWLTLPALLVLAGCQTSETTTPQSPPPAVAAVAATPAPAPAAPAATGPVQFPIRIKAGQDAAFTDSSGNVWQGDHGFVDGDVIERSDLNIANTKDPGLYRAERYGMSAFSQPLPKGKYVVKLHFCVTYDGIDGPGQRVFSFNVGGQEFKDFDVWVKAGGPLKAYVETVNVEVTNGKLDIKFTSNVENPEINAIEIAPAA